MGVFLGVAAVFFVVGICALVLEIQSPSFVMWNGIEVHGYTQHGLTYYHYAGKSYVIDNTHADLLSPRTSTTVWLQRSNPTDDQSAYIQDTATRWLDFSFVMSWFAVAAGIVAFGFLRRFRRRRRQVEEMGQFGAGLSDHVVREILHQRNAVTRPTVNWDDE